MLPIEEFLFSSKEVAHVPFPAKSYVLALDKLYPIGYTMIIVYYGTRRKPVEEFIFGLPIQDQAKIFACLKSIEELGFLTPRVAFRQIRGKLWEIKIETQSNGFRIFYLTVKRETLVLLHAYKKQSQKAPNKEIKIAENRMKEVLKNESLYVG